MTFQIYTIVPRYDDRDAIVGHEAIRHPYTFLTEQGAEAVAQMMARRDEECGGDYSYVVRPAGKSPFSNYQSASVVLLGSLDDDLPF